MPLVRYLQAALWFYFSAVPIQAQESHILEKIIQKYDTGDYEATEKELRQLLDKNPSNPHLLYNLGNTQLRLDKRGEAIASYLAARRFAPRDPDIRANLSFAIEQNKDALAPEKENSLLDLFFFWSKATTPLEVTKSFLLLLATACLFLGASFLKNKRLLRQSGQVLLSLSFLLGLASWLSWKFEEKWTAVTAKEASTYSGPSSHNTVVFKLNEGAPFLSKRKEGDWHLIELADGRSAWIEVKDIGNI